jgi:predicted acetyltransferase
MNSALELVTPNIDLIPSFLEYIKELVNEGRSKSISGLLDYANQIRSKGVDLTDDISAIRDYPIGYIAKLLNMEKGVDLAPSYFIPRTNLWVVVDREVVGDININHMLKDEAARAGINIPGYTLGQEHYSSNVGYQIKPSKRGKGYATEACHLALVYCKQYLNLKRVAISCNADNPASQRVIEKNGGVQDTPFVTESGDVKLKFWIDLENIL